MGRTVLLYAPADERAQTLATELAGASSDLTVEWESSRTDTRSRLAWPDVDCLVVVPGNGTDITAFLESITEKHPALPIVYYGLDRLSIVESAPTVTLVPADGPESIGPLAAQITALLDERDRQRETYDLDGETPARQYPNVDDQRLDELVESGGPDRETMRELLHKSQLFDAIIQTIPVHMFVKDEVGRHLYISEGYFEDDIDEFLDRADPEMDMVAEDHAWRAFEDDMHVVEAGEAIVDKEEYLGALDQWNLTSKVPWRDAEGNIVGLIGASRNITARKRREEEIQRQNERLESFSEIVSHDLRNPLQVARSATALLSEECDSERVETIEDAHERMATIIDDVLSLAKYGRTVVESEPIDLRKQALQAWETAGNEAGRLVVAEDLSPIRGDRSRVSRLLENLFRNAVEHSSTSNRTQSGDAVDHAGTDVTVRIEDIHRPPANQPGAPPREGFAVVDDGPGIPESEREAVLELGYSGEDGGTGFGLGIVAEIVEAHGWEIEITESESGGARFEITGVERPE
jgi:signal transduction histidine kinase